jgi:hypothetical protein
VNHLERMGQEVRVLAFRGFAEAELQRHADATVDLLDLKTIMSTLEGRLPGRRRTSTRLLRAPQCLFAVAKHARGEGGHHPW